MNHHLDLSRITKAMTDAYDVDFGEAEERLSAVRLAVVLDQGVSAGAAAQACVLTLLAAGRRTFSNVTLVADGDANLRRQLPHAHTLFDAARSLGVQIASCLPSETTHSISVNGACPAGVPFSIRCWWDGWLAGVRSGWDDRPNGGDWNPLAGVFAGALAVREVFATVRGVKTLKLTGNVVSLWEPWNYKVDVDSGPTIVHLARAMTVVGLGHLGQGFLWSLALLPGHGELLVLQDYQDAGRENAATGLLTSMQDVGRKKTRIAKDWCEHFGWRTALIERKFVRGTPVTQEDPALVISALDKLGPRQDVLRAGFHRMLDFGVGHGPVDFEICQFRSFVAGDVPTWTEAAEEPNVDERLRRKAYKALNDPCGAFPLASASVAVPFVGAALGALCVAQLLRLGAMERVPKILQIELSAPEVSSLGDLPAAEPAGFGVQAIDLIAMSASRMPSISGD